MNSKFNFIIVYFLWSGFVFSGRFDPLEKLPSALRNHDYSLLTDEEIAVYADELFNVVNFFEFTEKDDISINKWIEEHRHIINKFVFPMNRKTLLQDAASRCRNDYLIKKLLAAGADPKVMTDNGQLALNFAIANGYPSIIKALVEAYPESLNHEVLNFQDEIANARALGDKCLGLIAQVINVGKPEIVEQLLALGLNPNQKYSAGNYPLHIAASAGNLRIANALLDSGADINACDKTGKTALDMAYMYKKKLMSQSLEKRGAKKGCSGPKALKNTIEPNNTKQKIFTLQKSADKIYWENIIDKSFMTTMKGKFLNLGPKNNEDYLVSVKFSGRQGHQRDLTMSLEFSTKDVKSPQTLILPLRVKSDLDESIISFSPLKIDGQNISEKSTSYDGVKLFKKIKDKQVKDNNICVFSGQIKVINNIGGKIGLKGQCLFANINTDISWELVPPVEKTTAPKIVEVLNYPNPAEVSGGYKGMLNGESYKVIIPQFDSDNFVIPFEITTKDQRVNYRVLNVKASIIFDKKNTMLVTELIPLSKSEKTMKFFPGQTSFDGECYRSQKNKKAKKQSRPLCFEESFKIIWQNGQLVLSARTHSGLLVLTRHNEEVTIEEVTEENIDNQNTENDINISEENDYIWDFNIPEQNFLLEDDDEENNFEVVPPKLIALKEKKSANKKEYLIIRKEDELKYGKLGPTKVQKERDDRILRNSSPLIKQHGAEMAIDKKSSEKVLQRTPELDQQFIDELQPRRYKLNHLSDYASCSLFDSSNVVEDNIWFGQGFIKELGGYQIDQTKRIVLSLINLNGLQQFAPNASWCSFFNSEYNHTKQNREKGINVHCSYHANLIDNVKMDYLNISGHGLFQIRESKTKDEYLLYKVPGLNEGNKQVVYVMRKWSDHKKSTRVSKKETPLQSAYSFVGYDSNYMTKLNALIEHDDLKIKAMQVKNILIKNEDYNEIPYGDRGIFIKFINESTCYILTHNRSNWREAVSWDVQMINQKTAFISIVFENNYGHFEALTFKVKLNHDDTLELLDTNK